MTTIQKLEHPEKVEQARHARLRRLQKAGKSYEDAIGTVFEDEYLRIVRDPVQFPDGNLGTYLRVVETASEGPIKGVVCVPEFKEKFLLIRIFRYPLSSWEWEFPRGMIIPNLSAEESAIRELVEETGLKAKQIRSLGQVAPNDGILEGYAALFHIECLTGSEAKPDHQEAVSQGRWLSGTELFQMVSSGQIRDAYTLSALTLLMAQGIIRQCST